MDNLTHTMVGAAIGYAGLRHRARLAPAALLIGANLPDIDGVAYFIDPTLALSMRRSWTHGILAMIVLPVLLAGTLVLLEQLFHRQQRDTHPPEFRALLLVSALAVWTHPLLDLLNTYGVRLLMPFSNHWFHGDTLFFIDPWLWLPLVVGIVLARANGPVAARTGLAVATVYIIAMFAISAYTRHIVVRELTRVHIYDVASVIASPVPIDPFHRDVIVETKDGYLVGSADVLSGRTMLFGGTGIAKNLLALAPVAHRPDVRQFMSWSRAPFVEQRGRFLRIDDALYAGPRGGWVVLTVPLQNAAGK